MPIEKFKAAKLSIAANFLFIILKITVGLFTGSIAILAEALHSLLDFVASIFAYLGVSKGDEPSDESHPYGHEKYENLSAIIQMMLITVTAVIIMYEAVEKFSSPGVDFEEYGIILMIFTTVSAYFVSQYLYRVGAAEHSHALESDAHHFKTDVWSSIAVIAGLILSMLGFKQADPLAAMFVALLMLKLSVETGMQMLNILLEHSVEPKILERIQARIKRHPEVVRFHKLRARYIGAKIWVDVHINFDNDTTLYTAHMLAHNIKESIMEELPNVKEVNIHLEPAVNPKEKQARPK